MTKEEIIEHYHLKYFRGNVAGTSRQIHVGQIIAKTLITNPQAVALYFCSDTLPGTNLESIRVQSGYLYNYYIQTSDGTFPGSEGLVLSDMPFEEIQITHEVPTLAQIMERYHDKAVNLRGHIGVLYVKNSSLMYFCSDTLEGAFDMEAVEYTGKTYSYAIFITEHGETGDSIIFLDTAEEEAIDVNEPVSQYGWTSFLSDFIQSRNSTSDSVDRHTKKSSSQKPKTVVKITIEDIADCFNCDINELQIEGYKKDENTTV